MSESDKAAVAVYEDHAHADEAVRILQRAGFEMKRISVVGKDYRTEENVVGYYNAGDRIAVWGGAGAAWGGLWGLLFGTAFFAVPGVGPLLLGGPLVAALVSALETAVVVGGLSALGAALYGLGIPKDSVVRYESALRADKFLVIVHGTADEVARTADALAAARATQVDTHTSGPAAQAA